jgi:S1-C subfamily serine protease
MHTSYSERRRESSPSLASIFWQVLLLVLLGAFAFVVWRFGSNLLHRNPPAGPVAERPVKVRDALYENEKTLIELYRRAKPSVVNITTLATPSSRNPQQVPKGTGSGVVWDDQGNIVTNYHVIAGASGAIVTMSDGSHWQATLVGGQRDKDLAVIHIQAPKDKLHPIDIGESQTLQVGQSAYAIGNPFGLDHTFASGIVSALNREIESEARVTLSGMIQTTTPINPGNSGGPLLDSDGRLIGITTMILSPSGAWAGIGFAIPVDEVNKTVTQIINSSR